MEADPSSTAPVHPDVDQGNALLAATWSTTAVAFVFLALRFWARLSKRALAIDDACMLLSWVSFPPLSAILRRILTDRVKLLFLGSTIICMT